MTYDAIVIGAGPAGSTAARLLAQAGWSVAVVEKTPFPRRKVCGEFISATSLPLVEDGGIGEGVERIGRGEHFAERAVGEHVTFALVDLPLDRDRGRGRTALLTAADGFLGVH
jgi:flavin-dependent dehydrogenase